MNLRDMDKGIDHPRQHKAGDDTNPKVQGALRKIGAVITAEIRMKGHMKVCSICTISATNNVMGYSVPCGHVRKCRGNTLQGLRFAITKTTNDNTITASL